MRRWPVSTVATTLMPAASGLPAGLRVDGEAHRQALHHLDPIAGGIFRRQQGETRTGAWAGAFDLAGEFFARIGIDRKFRRLSGMDVAQVGFLEIGFHPDVLVGNQREQGGGGFDIAADLYLLDFGDDAVNRRAHHGVAEIKPGPVQGRLRLTHAGLAVSRCVGIAVEIGEGARGLGLCGRQFLPRRRDIVLAALQLRTGGDAIFFHLALAVIFALLIIQRIFRRALVGKALMIGRLQGLDFQARTGELGFGLPHGDFEAAGVQPQKHGSCPDE